MGKMALLEPKLTSKAASNVWKLYAYWFFHSLIFAYAIERLFGLERGLTIQQMVYLEILYAAMVTLLEVPTGALADRWSRKNLMILSAFFVFFEFLVLIFAFSFRVFALSTLCAAIGGALASGTSNAIFYDSLKAVRKENQYEKVLGRNHFFDRLAGMIAAIIGGFTAARFGLTFNYWLSLIGVAIAFFITFSLYEPKNRTSTGENKFWQLIKEAYNFLRFQPAIQFVLLYGVIIASTWIYLDEYWQIYLKEIHIPLAFFGIFSVGAQLFDSLGGLLAPHLKSRLSYRAIFSILVIASGLSVLFAAMIHTWYGAVLLLGIHMVSGIIRPLVSGYLHHRTASYYRATVDSFQALAMRLSSIIVGLIFGYFATRFSIFVGFRVLSFILIAYALFYLTLQFKFVKENSMTPRSHDKEETT